MEHLKIIMHSFVDVITNSSSTIYTTINERGVETVIELIDSLLQLGDSNLWAREIFVFEYTPEEESCPGTLDISIKEAFKTNDKAQVANTILNKLSEIYTMEEFYN